ncbi:MAG TPA: hypothetical protein PK899_13010, partial [Spirochaetota bacterium]|nr:hypothetical protein [Spirochaetota bacterium]
MKVNYVLLISLLIVGLLFVPAVSAEAITIDISDAQTISNNYVVPSPFYKENGFSVSGVYIQNIKEIRAPLTIVSFHEMNSNEFMFSGSKRVKISNLGAGEIGFYRNPSGSSYLYLIIDEWDVEKAQLESNDWRIYFLYNETTGTRLDKDGFIPGNPKAVNYGKGVPALIETNKPVVLFGDVWDTYMYQSSGYFGGNITVNSETTFKAKIIGNFTENPKMGASDNLQIIRTIEGISYESNVLVTGHSSDIPYLNNTGYGNTSVLQLPALDRPFKIDVYSNGLNRIYSYTIPIGTVDPGDPGDPVDPGETPIMRTGTVTMTDHNGTSITGFEVTAVNHYTGQEYNVST